MPRAGQSYYRM